MVWPFSNDKMWIMPTTGIVARCACGRIQYSPACVTLQPGPLNGTIWLVPDKSVRQFHHTDFGAAAKLNLGVVADPFHLRNKQHVYVNVARFTSARA